jgi:hypothetical protein
LDIRKQRKRSLTGNKPRHELEMLVETPQDVQHKRAVLNGFTKVGESVDHALHLAAVLVDGEGAFGEVAELGVEEHGARLAIVEELLFQTEPRSPSGDTVALVDDVREVGGDGVEDPGDDDEVHAGPGSVGEERRVTEDMVLQGEAAEDEEHVAAPLRVVGRLEVQNDRNHIPHVRVDRGDGARPDAPRREEWKRGEEGLS